MTAIHTKVSHNNQKSNMKGFLLEKNQTKSNQNKQKKTPTTKQKKKPPLFHVNPIDSVKLVFPQS